MSRVKIFNKKQPKPITVNDKEVWICQCGLSADFPFCNGTHHKIQDEPENELYQYDEKLNRKKVKIVEDN
ncbi:MAG: hypothetical protein KatS3mg090_0935 [Patescibacteria group bacterium]|nr:MAG: hypothetical protein KatS3mg090_0935 [Patescibacteria group bacterium]